jgi:hypothetical protein
VPDSTKKVKFSNLVQLHTRIGSLMDRWYLSILLSITDRPLLARPRDHRMDRGNCVRRNSGMHVETAAWNWLGYDQAIYASSFISELWRTVDAETIPRINVFSTGLTWQLPVVSVCSCLSRSM